MRNVIIPDGKTVAHNLTIGFLDSSLCGVETTIRASGVVYKDGRFEQFEISEEDISVKEFLEAHKTWTFYAYGSVHIFDELNYVDMDVAPINFGKYKSLFPELADIDLPLESYISDAYSVMRNGFDFSDWSYRIDID